MPEFVEGGGDGCEVEGCDRAAAVRLDVPWEDTHRDVCPAHARVWNQKEGVVAMPIEDVEDEWP